MNGALRRFRNHPPRRLFVERERAAFEAALQNVRQEFGRTYPLRLGGSEEAPAEVVPVRDPSHPDRDPLGYVASAGPEATARAIEIASDAADAWARRPLAERVAILSHAAGLLAERQDVVAAWEVYEAAKAWTEALADVGEAIDYLRFYGLMAEDLAASWLPYRPRGVVGVIPPWNFPVAIPCGMTAAALVCGNAVILKPAEQTPLAAWQLVSVLHEAGVPEEALIWLPGRGEVAGAALVDSALVDMIAFTGSAAVGIEIYRRGGGTALARGGIRTTVAEMGGKNPILVFPDADLDEAVLGILSSAFGHSNQKCSAASRVLIHRSIYDRLRQRLVEGADSLARGPADKPGTVLTPLIDDDARARVAEAAARAATEGRVLLAPSVAAAGDVGPAPALVEIRADRAATARTTTEEIFGPVLALTPFAAEDEAIALANDTAYALTAGVYSRSPTTIARVVQALDAGNVYVNRPTTGARVGVEPFGGHKLSGTGPKAGSSEYLWAFVTRRDGLRAEPAEPTPSARVVADAPQPYSALPRERAAAVQRAVALLRGEWRDEWAGSLVRTGARLAEPDVLSAIDRLLQRLDEVAVAEPTLQLRGQQTYVRWDQPRGCGVVITDGGCTVPHLLALIAGSILAGNGALVLPDTAQAPIAALVVRALRAGGVPSEALAVASGDLNLSAAIADPNVTFAAVDAALDRTRQIYRALATASGTPSSPVLKALITLADGPGPDEPGFLRRFALPKTVAIRTLHLGAALDLPDLSSR